MKSLKHSEDNATNFEEFYNYLCEWTPKRDVFAIRFTPLIIGGATSISAALLNQRFRRAVKLRGEGFATSFLPNVFFPSILTTGIHLYMVLKPLLTEDRKKCPVCLELRSGAISVIGGVVYPSLLIPINVFLSANRYYTFPIPSINKEPLECLKLAYKILWKPIYPKICLFASIQLIIGMGLAHFQLSNFDSVMEKIAYMESVNEKRRLEKPARLQ